MYRAVQERLLPQHYLGKCRNIPSAKSRDGQRICELGENWVALGRELGELGECWQFGRRNLVCRIEVTE